MTTDKAITKTRIGLIAIIALFLLSPLIAWMVYTGIIEIDFESSGGKNYGELIHPARPLTNVVLQNMDGARVDITQFEGLWSLVEVAKSPCVDDCGKNIYKMRQIRLALGKDAHRVQRIVLSEGLDSSDKLMIDNPGTRLYRIVEGSAGMLQHFPGYSDGGIPAISGRIYIIDPLGNLMMRYPHEANPSEVLKDLRQLLKATWIRPRT